MDVNKGGIGNVKYPLISDLNKSIARAYDVLLGAKSATVLLEDEEIETTIDGNVTIRGSAFSDQDILNFISNLNEKSLVEQASLVDMNVATTETEQSSSNKKGFTILCKLKGV